MYTRSICFRHIMRVGYYTSRRFKSFSLSPPFWHFSFDHEKYILQLNHWLMSNGAENFSFHIYDFDSFTDYPGDKMFSSMGITHALTSIPPESAKNRRLTDEQVTRNHINIIKSQSNVNYRRHLSTIMQTQYWLEPSHKKQMAETIYRKFGPGSRRLLNLPLNKAGVRSIR